MAPLAWKRAARGIGAGEVLARARRRAAAAGRGERPAATLDAAAPPWPFAGVVVDPATAIWRA